ncbi:MAG: type II secretion system F family protein [Alphaproteobacteria bacterium]|nr:type II secretion system F family protein [Alphaproteobacteria bacterium]
MSPVIILGSLIILVIIVMMIALLRSNSSTQRKRNMSVIRGQAADISNKAGKADPNRRRADEIARKLKEQGDATKNRKSTLSQQLEQGGIKLTVKKFITIFAVIALVIVLMGLFVFKWSPPLAILYGVIFFFGGQRFFISRKIKKRQKKFLLEFADALEAMVRLLKAGMPVTEAIKMSSREFAGPVGEEMSRMYDAQKIGVSLPEAALDAARRMPLTEMQMFATGVAIQAQTGASLSEVLMNLAGVIRARFRLRRKVQALSSEAKSSAAIIGALPILVGGGMFAINPDFINPLVTTTTGKILIVFCVVWMSTGILVMRAMINFKI